MNSTFFYISAAILIVILLAVLIGSITYYVIGSRKQKEYESKALPSLTSMRPEDLVVVNSGGDHTIDLPKLEMGNNGEYIFSSVEGEDSYHKQPTEIKEEINEYDLSFFNDDEIIPEVQKPSESQEQSLPIIEDETFSYKSSINDFMEDYSMSKEPEIKEDFTILEVKKEEATVALPPLEKPELKTRQSNLTTRRTLSNPFDN